LDLKRKGGERENADEFIIDFIGASDRSVWVLQMFPFNVRNVPQGVGCVYGVGQFGYPRNVFLLKLANNP